MAGKPSFAGSWRNTILISHIQHKTIYSFRNKFHLKASEVTVNSVRVDIQCRVIFTCVTFTFSNCCQRRRCCYTTFSLGIPTSVICHTVNTQNVKTAKRDRPLIVALNRCETFENLLHIDIAPVRTLGGILH